MAIDCQLKMLRDDRDHRSIWQVRERFVCFAYAGTGVSSVSRSTRMRTKSVRGGRAAVCGTCSAVSHAGSWKGAQKRSSCLPIASSLSLRVLGSWILLNAEKEKSANSEKKLHDEA